MTLRLLVLDAYPSEGRAALREVGSTEAGRLYERLLERIGLELSIDLGFPADAGPVLPAGVSLTDYDGALWTGSSLTIHHVGDPRVTRQLELARALRAAGVPGFGSCWAAQLACVAAGGRCAPCSRGREFGVSRAIRLSAAGSSHPLFAGKPSRFDAFTSHADEVVELPTEAGLLASNDWSRVQAVAVGGADAPFWAVQYHPEYDPREVARLCLLRADELVAQGEFQDRAGAERWAAEMERLHADPGDAALRERLGVEPSLLDPQVRSLEVDNWIRTLVVPRATARRRAG